MERRMEITGMMCGHCEKSVKKALESIDGVQEAVVNREDGTAIITCGSETDNIELKKAVEDLDYVVVAIN